MSKSSNPQKLILFFEGLFSYCLVLPIYWEYKIIFKWHSSLKFTTIIFFFSKPSNHTAVQFLNSIVITYCENQFSFQQGSPQHSEDPVDPSAETQPAGEAEVMESQVDPEAETQVMETADTDSQGRLCRNRL